MAKMIPLELKDGEYESSGEKEVFEALKIGLSDEWIVIYSLRWITDDEIFLNRSNGESDFILINPNYGIMVLELKGGSITCINGEWFSISSSNIKRSIKDPEKQANEAKYNLLSKLRSNNINSYITTAVWFPDCIKDKVSLPLSMPKEIILDMLSFNNIEERIVNVFNYRANKESFIIRKLLDSDYKKIIDILNPKVDIKIPLVRISNKINMKYIKLNDEQNHCFEQLDGNKIISVSGNAGTGKTVLAVKKAFRESKIGKKVLFLCYNTLLKENISKESDDNFEVFSIHSFAEDYLNKYNKISYDDFQENGSYEEMMNSFIKEASNNKAEKRVFYDSIIIDEGQDFTKEWFEVIKEFLHKDSSLCVFYDKNQMLYNKYGRLDISFLEIGTKYELKRNMRNTDEIYLSALSIIDISKDNVKLNGVTGIKPDIIFSENLFSKVEHLRNIITELKKNEYLSDNNITVLTMEARKKLKYKKSIEDIFNGDVESIRKFKGLENDVIIIPDVPHNFMDDIDLRNLLYVGMSRAKVHVILIIDTEEFNRKQRESYKKEIKEKILSLE